MTAVTDSIIDRDADICLQNDTFVLQDNASYIVYSPFSELIVRVSSYPYKNSIIDRQLKKQGFFSDLPDTTRQITHWSKFKHLTLLLTRRCNLNCVYCYASGGSGKHQHSDMPINLALDACEWYINHLRDERIRVTFHGGGEPTLEQKTIKKVVGYVNKTGSGKKIRYLITTNGTMNQSFLQWMMDNDFAISISMDGPPEIQDRNRPLANGGASHFLVEESVRYLVKRNYSFTIRLTYDLCDNVEKIVHYFGKLGVKICILNYYFRLEG